MHYSSHLGQAARFHSQEMAELNFFAHETHASNANLFDGETGFSYRVRKYDEFQEWGGVSENIAAGYATPAAVTKGWLESEGHCNNIYSDSWDYLGLGYYFKTDSNYYHYYSQNFASVSTANQEMYPITMGSHDTSDGSLRGSGTRYFFNFFR